MFFLTQKLLPLLRASASKDEPARIVNLASVYALRYSQQPTFSYSASKAAVVQLTQQLAASLVKDHINVNAIAPGLFPSNMTAYLMEDEEALNKNIPMNRMGKLERCRRHRDLFVLQSLVLYDRRASGNRRRLSY